MIAVIDYDAGNLKSVEKALAYLGETPVITRDREELLAADKVILPGVGAFGDAMERLHQYGLVDVIKEIIKKGTPFLGICLGLQLMFESSEESPGVEGLGLLPGKILKIPEAPGMKVPTYGLELPESTSGFQIVSGHSRWQLCIFCPFLLSESRIRRYCSSYYGIRDTYSRSSRERKPVRLPVPSGKEQPDRS